MKQLTQRHNGFTIFDADSIAKRAGGIIFGDYTNIHDFDHINQEIVTTNIPFENSFCFKKILYIKYLKKQHTTNPKK